MNDRMRSDALSTALTAARVTGQVLLHERYAAPWALEVPGGEALAGALGLPRRAVAFHFVRRGGFRLTWGAERVDVGEGHVAIGFGGLPHRMSAGRDVRAVSLSDHLGGRRVGARTGARTELVCGALALEGSEIDPFVEALPPLLVAPVGDRGVVRRLAEELDAGADGSAFAVARLAELMCLEAIRSHAASGGLARGWFRAIADRDLERAMRAVRSDPGGPWTVEAMAATVGLSPSRFAARFRDAMGEPPMRFVTRLRMSEAERLLERPELRVHEVAARVGYESTSSFTRVFRQHIGRSPRAWRAVTGAT